MFRFRGKRKDNGEWVVGCYCEKYSRACIYNKKDGFWYEIHPHALSVSFGKLDSNKQEIFASFEIDGVMTTGGDAVRVNGNNYNIKYSPDLASFIAVNVNGKESGKLFHYIDIDNLTIIGKQGGGNE